MYSCKKCGNKKYFNEINVYKTFLVIDEKTGELISNNDCFIYMDNVTCEICGASSEDGSISTINKWDNKK